MISRRAIGLALAALLTGSIGAGSAQADRRPPVPFDLFSGTTQTEGRAKAKGKVRFLDNGRLRVKGYINDICPGDGYAAVLEIEVSYNDFTRDIRRRTHGLCHENKRDVDFKTRRLRERLAGRGDRERDPPLERQGSRKSGATATGSSSSCRRVTETRARPDRRAGGARAAGARARARRRTARPGLEAGLGRRPAAGRAADRRDAARRLPARARPEGPMQGRVPAGRRGGLPLQHELVGHEGATGGYKVHRFVDKAGHECAYYDTTLLFPTNAQNLSGEPTGVAVLDMTDPAKPVRTATLVTPAMQTPHESLVLNEQARAARRGDGQPGRRSRHRRHLRPQRGLPPPGAQSSLPVGVLGHESGFAPDGNTFYATSLGTGHDHRGRRHRPEAAAAVWVGQYHSHGMTVSDDGNRAYLAARDGLIILDISEIQARKPNPQVREVSRLDVADTLTIPQVAIPVTIGGKPYLVEIDEFSSGRVDGSVAAQRAAGRRRADHRHLRRDDAEGRGLEHPARGPPAREPRGDRRRPGRDEPRAGLRRPLLQRPAARRARDRRVLVHRLGPARVRHPRPAAPEGDRLLRRAADGAARPAATPSNYAMSSPAFVPERGEIWYSDGNSGFYALRMDPACGRSARRAAPAGASTARGFRSVSARPRGRRVGWRSRAAPTAGADRRLPRLRGPAGAAGAARRSPPRTVHLAAAPRGRLRRALHDAGRPSAVVLGRGADGRFRVRPPHQRARAAAWCAASGSGDRCSAGDGAGRLVPPRGPRAGVGDRRARAQGRQALPPPSAGRFRFVLSAHGLPRGRYTRAAGRAVRRRSRSRRRSPRADCDIWTVNPRAASAEALGRCVRLRPSIAAASCCPETSPPPSSPPRRSPLAILVLGWLTSGLITGVWSPRDQVASVTHGAVTLASPSDRGRRRAPGARSRARFPRPACRGPAAECRHRPRSAQPPPRRPRPPARRHHAGSGHPGARRHADRDPRAGGDRRAGLDGQRGAVRHHHQH